MNFGPIPENSILSVEEYLKNIHDQNGKEFYFVHRFPNKADTALKEKISDFFRMRNLLDEPMDLQTLPEHSSRLLLRYRENQALTGRSKIPSIETFLDDWIKSIVIKKEADKTIFTSDDRKDFSIDLIKPEIRNGWIEFFIYREVFPLRKNASVEKTQWGDDSCFLFYYSQPKSNVFLLNK